MTRTRPRRRAPPSMARPTTRARPMTTSPTSTGGSAPPDDQGSRPESIPAGAGPEGARGHAPFRRGAPRQPRDPSRPVAPDVSRTGAGRGGPRRPVRARPDGRLLRPRPPPAVLVQHDRRGGRQPLDPLPDGGAGDRVVHAASAG